MRQNIQSEQKVQREKCPVGRNGTWANCHGFQYVGVRGALQYAYIRNCRMADMQAKVPYHRGGWQKGRRCTFSMSHTVHRGV
jgi:hypothetical protein